MEHLMNLEHLMAATNCGNEPQQDAGDNVRKARKRGLHYFAGREWYLFKIDLFLDGRVPGRRRKGIRDDLRNGIDVESEMGSLKEVLGGLGNPRTLASSYVE